MEREALTKRSTRTGTCEKSRPDPLYGKSIDALIKKLKNPKNLSKVRGALKYGAMKVPEKFEDDSAMIGYHTKKSSLGREFYKEGRRYRIPSKIFKRIVLESGVLDDLGLNKKEKKAFVENQRWINGLSAEHKKDGTAQKIIERGFKVMRDGSRVIVFRDKNGIVTHISWVGRTIPVEMVRGRR